MSSPSLQRSIGERAVFRERARCVACDGADLEVVWQGRFCDEPVRSWLQTCHYTADVDRALGDQAFARVACRACGMRFHRRVLADEWLATLYDGWISPAQVEAFESDVRRQRSDSFIIATQQVKHILRLRHLAGDAAHRLRLLDFGCGDGRFLAFGALFGFEVCGVDASAARRARAARLGVTVVRDLADLPDEGFDCVTLFEVLEHVMEPQALLAAVRARMRPDAVLLIEVPNCRGIGVPTSLAEFDAIQPLEHVNHFTPETLTMFCRRAGFVPAPRIPAHVTTGLIALVKTEVSRLLRRATTSQYFRRS